jgi:hypothetical protein
METNVHQAPSGKSQKNQPAKGGPAAPAATPVAAAPAATTRRAAFGPTDLIVLDPELKGANPKKRTAGQRFALYAPVAPATTMTVAEYRKAVTKWGGNEKLADRDISWDMKKGWITIKPASTK